MNTRKTPSFKRQKKDATVNSNLGIKPSINLSLSVPKYCLKHFDGENYIGGRFLPAEIKSEFNLSLPEYPDQEQSLKCDLYLSGQTV